MCVWVRAMVCVCVCVCVRARVFVCVCARVFMRVYMHVLFMIARDMLRLYVSMYAYSMHGCMYVMGIHWNAINDSLVIYILYQM